MRPSVSTRQQGLSIVELLVAAGILAILVALMVPVTDRFQKRAEKVKCISQMRTLHTSFTAHVIDKGHWPQLPDDDRKWTEDQFFRFFAETLEPYGASRETWLCPSDKLHLQFERSELEKKDRFFGSYVPTAFDKTPQSPFRWNQPWLLERGNFHGRGTHVLMPDGTVNDSQNPFHGR